MNTSGRWLLVSILAVVLVAPPAHSRPQSQKDQLNTVMTDLIALKESVAALQRSSDQKSAELKGLFEQIMARLGAVDTLNSSVHKLGESLANVKATDERSVVELQDARGQLKKI